MALDNNPESLKSLWDALPEPFRAAILSTVLGILLALRATDGRPFGRKCIDVAACGLTGFMAGYILHTMEFDPWVIWAANGAAAYLGVDKIKSLVDKMVDGVTDIFLGKKQGE